MVPAGFDLLVHYAREHVLRAALHAHQWPFWNPYEFGGFPLWADPQTGLLYPLTLLRGLPVPAFLTWTLVLHVWLFGAGGYALARAVGCRRAIAVIAGIALMFGGVLVPRVYAGHVDLIRTAAWTPLILALATRSFARDRLMPLPGLVLALCCQVLGGWLQHVVYDVACIAAYALFVFVWPSEPSSGGSALRLRSGHPEHESRGEDPPLRTGRSAPLVQLAVLGLLTAGLTAVQTLPTLQLVRAGGRTAGVPFIDAIESAVHMKDLPGLMEPDYSDTIPFESWERSAYAGVLLPLLVPFAFLDRRRRRAAIFFALLAISALALASGGLPYRLHYLLLPMFRLPGRLMAFWTIAIVIIGALGLEWIAECVRVRSAIAAALAVAAIATTADTYFYARRFIAPRPASGRFAQQLPVPVTPGGRMLSICEHRIHALELVALGTPTVDGYNPYFIAGMARFASLVRGEHPKPLYISFPRIGESETLPDLSLLNLMNVTEILACAPASGEGQQNSTEGRPEGRPLRLGETPLGVIAEAGGVVAYRNPQAAGRVVPLGDDGPRCPAETSGESGNGTAFAAGVYRGDRFDGRVRVNVVMPRGGPLLLSEPYYPARRAAVDGVDVPITPAFDALSAICVGAGAHTVELRYDASRIELGAALTLLTAIVWIAAMRRGGSQQSL